MKGIGRTVFEGQRVEEFQVEILGVLENLGPKQSIILARLSGGPLERTGVLQGMSGSPVFVDGRLLGAVALAFPFSKEPIAGIRPIAQMLASAGPGTPTAAPAPLRPQALLRPGTTSLLPVANHLAAPTGEPKLMEIATPVSFSGFSKATLEQFAPELRQLGFEPRQALSGGGKPKSASTDPTDLEPGSMITVQLVSGDMAIGADGTVTHVDGRRVYAFGHQFMNIGPTELPFARASVITLLSNIQNSFKISAAREWMGTIVHDGNAAVTGEVGRQPSLIPVSLAVNGPVERAAGQRQQYKLRMVRDRLLTPFLLQMAIFSAIESTQRTLGTESLRLKGRMEFEGVAEPIVLDNLFSADFNVPLQVSLAATIPLSWVLQSDYSGLRLKNIDLEVEAYPERRQFRVDEVYPARREIRPGSTLPIHIVLAGENGREETRQVGYPVPNGLPAGPLFVTVSDGGTANLTEYVTLVNATPRSPTQLIRLANQTRPNNKLYVRVWRAEPTYALPGGTLPDPPASLALLLGRSPAVQGGTGGPSQNTKLAEYELPLGDFTVTGAKTIRVDIKE